MRRKLLLEQIPSTCRKPCYGSSGRAETCSLPQSPLRVSRVCHHLFLFQDNLAQEEGSRKPCSSTTRWNTLSQHPSLLLPLPECPPLSPHHTCLLARSPALSAFPPFEFSITLGFDILCFQNRNSSFLSPTRADS